jgi:hypothetical protein
MEPDVGEFGRLFQRFLEQMGQAARDGQSSPLRELLDAHLGADSSAVPVVSESFMPYDHANVQLAVDAYLDQEGRSFELHGATGQQRHYGSFSDLIEQSRWNVVGLGSVDFENVPIGPDETLACVKFGLYLIDDRGAKLVLLMRGVDERTGQMTGTLEVLGSDREASRALLDDVRRLMVELNVFRGQVLAFGESQMGNVMIGPIVFMRRPGLERDHLILPDDVLASVEREVFGMAEQRDRLRASGQHVKRGVLLWGPPGTGKTHTVRYLMSRLREHTVFVLTGGGLHMVRAACALARMLQPAVVVLEDIDLVAQHREVYGMSGNPLLFDVLNEIDGIAEDADVTFVLTTNRADLLEPALAARPGRVDLAVEIGLPDGEARRRLIELYGRGLSLQLTDVDAVIRRTGGVTASFIKELMRKSALVSAQSSDGGTVIEVTDASVAEALDELLSERSALTRALLGGAGSDDLAEDG